MTSDKTEELVVVGECGDEWPSFTIEDVGDEICPISSLSLVLFFLRSEPRFGIVAAV